MLELNFKIVPLPTKNFLIFVINSLVTQSCLTLQHHGKQHARPPYPSPTPGVY